MFTASYSAPFYALAVRLSDGVLVDGATVAATAGNLLAIYATGLDGIAAAQAPGLVFTGTSSAASLPSATVGGTAVTISSCDLVGTGVYRIVLTVPWPSGRHVPADREAERSLVGHHGGTANRHELGPCGADALVRILGSQAANTNHAAATPVSRSFDTYLVGARHRLRPG